MTTDPFLIFAGAPCDNKRQAKTYALEKALDLIPPGFRARP